MKMKTEEKERIYVHPSFKKLMFKKAKVDNSMSVLKYSKLLAEDFADELDLRQEIDLKKRPGRKKVDGFRFGL